MKAILNLTHQLRDSKDGSLTSIASSLSTRQLLRISKRLKLFPEEDAYHAIHKACLARYFIRFSSVVALIISDNKTFWEVRLLTIWIPLLWDHSVWLSHVHKTPLQMRVCSLFTSQPFCITIISCSLTLKERPASSLDNIIFLSFFTFSYSWT